MLEAILNFTESVLPPVVVAVAVPEDDCVPVKSIYDEPSQPSTRYVTVFLKNEFAVLVAISIPVRLTA